MQTLFRRERRRQALGSSHRIKNLTKPVIERSNSLKCGLETRSGWHLARSVFPSMPRERNSPEAKSPRRQTRGTRRASKTFLDFISIAGKEANCPNWQRCCVGKHATTAENEEKIVNSVRVNVFDISVRATLYPLRIIYHHLRNFIKKEAYYLLF